MVCIYCGSRTRITNSRAQKRQPGTWRRHRCTVCEAVFTSIERADYNTSLSLKDAASHIIPFDRDKLFISLYEACKHRRSAVQDAGELADTVIGSLLRHSQTSGLVSRAELVAAATTALRRFDSPACTHYAAYHR